MDGVLVDSEPLWHHVWETIVFPDVQAGDPTLEEVTGRSYTETLPMLAEQYGLEHDPEHYAELIEERGPALYASEAEADPAVHELLDTVRDRGFLVGIVSSSAPEWIATVVDRFDLEPLDVVQSAMDAPGDGKPSPDVYEHAADLLGVDPSECVVIEDSENGVRAAAAAGATVIRFALGEQAAPMPEADAVAADPEDLERILLGLLDTAD